MKKLIKLMLKIISKIIINCYVKAFIEAYIGVVLINASHQENYSKESYFCIILGANRIIVDAQRYLKGNNDIICVQILHQLSYSLQITIK